MVYQLFTVTAGHFSASAAERDEGPINLNCHKCTTYKKLLEYVPLSLLDKWYQCANESVRAEQYIIMHILSNTSRGIALHTSPWSQDAASQWEVQDLVFQSCKGNEFAAFLRDRWKPVFPNLCLKPHLNKKSKDTIPPLFCLNAHGIFQSMNKAHEQKHNAVIHHHSTKIDQHSQDTSFLEVLFLHFSFTPKTNCVLWK